MEESVREQRLPAWARSVIAELRREVEHQTFAANSTEEENARLRAVIDGKFSGESDADTFYINEDTAAQIPLGLGVSIRFPGYDVHWSEPTGELLIESNRPMYIKLCDYNQMVAIVDDRENL